MFYIYSNSVETAFTRIGESPDCMMYGPWVKKAIYTRMACSGYFFIERRIKIMFTLHDNYRNESKEYKSLQSLSKALRNAKMVNTVLSNYGEQKMHTVAVTMPQTTSSGALVPFEELVSTMLKAGCAPHISGIDTTVKVQKRAPVSMRATRAVADTQTREDVLETAGSAIAAKLFSSTGTKPANRVGRRRNDWKSRKRVRQWSQSGVRVVSRNDLRVATANDENRLAVTTALLSTGHVC